MCGRGANLDSVARAPCKKQTWKRGRQFAEHACHNVEIHCLGAPAERVYEKGITTNDRATPYSSRRISPALGAPPCPDEGRGTRRHAADHGNEPCLFQRIPLTSQECRATLLCALTAQRRPSLFHAIWSQGRSRKILLDQGCSLLHR